MGCHSCLNVTSAIASFVSFLLFLIAACGNSDDEDVLQDVPWASGDINFGTIDVWMGTSALFAEGASKTVLYKDYCSPGETWCEDCESAGASSLALTCLALILSVAVIVTNVLQMTGKDTIVVKVVGLLCALCAAAFPIIAYFLFRGCMQSFVDENLATMGNGISLWILLIGFALMLISSINVSITMCGCGKKDAEGNSSNL